MSNLYLMNEIAERVFFCIKDGTHKFWRVSVRHEIQTVCWGRIGTVGQTLSRTYADFDEAKAAAAALVAQKTAKGYAEVSVEEANAALPVPVQRAGKQAAPQLLLRFDDKDDAAAADGTVLLPLVSSPSAWDLPLSLF